MKGEKMIEDPPLISIRLPDSSLLILTKEEFKKALRRGDTVLHNRKARVRPNILEPYLEALEVQNA
jgi:hypothetical protein